MHKAFRILPFGLWAAALRALWEAGPAGVVR